MIEDTKWSAPFGRYTYGEPLSHSQLPMSEWADADRANTLYAPPCERCRERHPRAMSCPRARDVREEELDKTAAERFHLEVWAETLRDAARFADRMAEL